MAGGAETREGLQGESCPLKLGRVSTGLPIPIWQSHQNPSLQVIFHSVQEQPVHEEILDDFTSEYSQNGVEHWLQRKAVCAEAHSLMSESSRIKFWLCQLEKVGRLEALCQPPHP